MSAADDADADMRTKVRAIVTALDADGDGYMSVPEVKVLIAKMTDVEVPSPTLTPPSANLTLDPALKQHLTQP